MSVDLKALSEEELREFIHSEGLEGYRADQLIYWIYEKGVEKIEDITVFSKQLREDLSRKAYISSLQLLRKHTSEDGTEKYLFKLEDGETIETVLIPDDDRLTLCVSSQVGCPMGCRFCLTAKIGFRRNLRPHEIVDQIIKVQGLIKPKRITNIVFMGMGEPLKNTENVSEALKRITSLLRISKRRITLSTSGIVPEIKRLPAIAPQVNLAISLNATRDSIRTQIMPVNRTYPINELLEACRKYPLEPRRRITFEYILIKDVNDSPADASRLAELLRGIRAKINLIPFNPHRELEFKRPSERAILRFQKILTDRGYTAIIRKSKGIDISAACGQLSGEYNLLRSGDF
ncbi:MAG: 23S rRNA (adenine(2503)-C(2))-methyltransferase RlmN [Nitrospirae bacterium]|nr:23S rRNA (adenine(2503)-C(2))-methyltransferase RlmN [Nitrospirota bacterium]